MSVRKTWPSQLQTRRVMIEQERQISMMQRMRGEITGKQRQTERERERLIDRGGYESVQSSCCVLNY